MSEEVAAPLVVALGADLMFASRLASAVGRLGGQLVQARDGAQLRRALVDLLASSPHPSPLAEGEGASSHPSALPVLSEEGASNRPPSGPLREGTGRGADVPHDRLPALVLIDLGARGLDLDAAVRSAREARTRLVVAYGPHKDVAARRRALDAGCDRWLANSKLFETLPELLSRGSGT